MDREPYNSQSWRPSQRQVGKRRRKPEEKPSKEYSRVIKEVTGLIFQFSPEAILFEFTVEEDSDQFQVGMVEPSKVKVGDRNIPVAEVQTKEALGRYIEVGDELECEVVKEEGMAMVSVQEEDEEGAMVEVEVQPDWRAR